MNLGKMSQQREMPLSKLPHEYHLCSHKPHQLRIGSALKPWPGSTPRRACRPNRSEFSLVFSETRVNTG